VLNPSQTLLITSERKNKGKGGKKHAASPRRLLTEGAEPIVPLSLSLFFSVVFFLRFLCCIFFRGNEPGQPLLKRTDRDGGPRRRHSGRARNPRTEEAARQAKRGQQECGTRSAARGQWCSGPPDKLVRTEGSSRQAGNADCTQKKRVAVEQACSRNENRKQGTTERKYSGG
jgi:hypothetical protein